MTSLEILQEENVKRKILASFLSSLALVLIYGIFYIQKSDPFLVPDDFLSFSFIISLSLLIILSFLRLYLFIRSKKNSNFNLRDKFPFIITLSLIVWCQLIVVQEYYAFKSGEAADTDRIVVHLFVLIGLLLSLPQNLRFIKSHFFFNLALINTGAAILLYFMTSDFTTLLFCYGLMGLMNTLVISQNLKDWKTEHDLVSKDFELQEIIDCFPGAVIECSSGKIYRVNKYGQKTFFNGLEIISGQTELSKFNALNSLNQMVDEFLERGVDKFLQEKLVLTTLGQRTHLFVLTKTRIQTVIIVAVDIHDLAVAREVAEVQTKLALDKSRLATLGLMSAGIAHEISNPLALIGMIAETSAANFHNVLSNPDLARKKFQKIAITVQRANKVISSLKNMARSHENCAEEAIEVNDLIQDVIELISDRLKEAQVHLEIDCQYSEEKIVCRPSEICQVLINAIQNSIHAVESLDEKWIRVHIYKSQDQILQLEIIDSGKGIPEEIRSRLAEPLFTTKGYGKGTGLGLTLSNQIMKNHGGQLFFDYQRKNTTLVLQLPLKFC